jgi:Mlc titration factor MtfA (ptsG expression regulator)
VIGWFKALFSSPAPVPVPTQADWDGALALPLFAGLEGVERLRLRALALELLQGKRFSPVADAAPTGLDIAAIAVQAALPVMNLGANWYKGWNEVVLYPAEFVHEADETDEIGVVHQVRHVRTGEAWEGGPLVLALDAVRASGRLEGYNVVIHEFAHKLDMNNGTVNGFPPMHADMKAEDWSVAFSAAFEDFRGRLETMENEEASVLDPYAAESPAEFFAVMSEYFFEWPELVVDTYPAVYEQLRRFYRQDPLRRLSRYFGTMRGANA